MRLARFTTVRSRLLVLLVGIALPIAVLTALTAVTTYRNVTRAIVTSQMHTADEYAVRTRIWYRGALRSLLAGGAGLAQVLSAQPAACDQSARSVLSEAKGYRAIYVVDAAGGICSSAVDQAVNRADLAAAMQTLKERPAVQIWGGAELGRARYDHLILAGQSYLAIYASSQEPSRGFREGLLLVDPDLLDQAFELGDADSGLVVALVGRTSGVVVARGAGDDIASWLPARAVVPQIKERWEAPSRSGADRVYAARMVAEPDLYIVASFDNALAQAARTQFLVLLLAPLLTLALLCVVYLRAIDKHCVRWLRGIEAAARARSPRNAVRAVIADDMPADIRSVAEAFNTMIDEQEVRQRRLQTALDDNRFLVRELHHRVKNSLQVVQSYIGLTKRDYRGEARMVLADAECRVHVLSAAYRFTLADGEMQPVRVDLFIEDVVTMISNLLRKRDQRITSSIETRASLTVDRIIPLGFLIVDVVSRALRTTPGASIRISIADIDETVIEIAIAADVDVDHIEPPKLFAGLVAQIEAVQESAPQGRELGAWRVTHRA